MSKRELKKYIKELNKEQLEEQITELYSKFKEVKTYYDFAFNPNEEKLIDECKFKISKEYFPVSGRKPKARRSVAQKQIKHFKQLGVDAHLIADIMLYNIEIAQTFSSERIVKQDSFYTSILKSFEEAIKYIEEYSIQAQFKERVQKIVQESENQNWFNKRLFDNLAELY